MSKVHKTPQNEWSSLVNIDEVSTSGKNLKIAPQENEKRAIAKRLDIVSLNNLSAELQLNRESGHVIHITGTIKASVTQSCVNTLEPLQTNISEDFEAWFADQQSALSFKKAQHEARNKKELIDLPMLEESEDPEPVVDGKIDLGELVVQHLSLALDPFPCKPGSKAEPIQEKVSKDHLKQNPFAALKNWRPKD